ncbi:MAG: hypothetical protein ACJ75B_08395 [Flavisolibacter sp.]
MKFNQPIKIDLLDFFKTGRFDCLKLGQTKEWILSNFPFPDGAESHIDEVLKNDIWHYGNIELHFNKGTLFLVFSDYIHELDGGDSIQLSKWLINDPDQLNLNSVMTQLNAERIDFEKKTEKYGDQYYVRLKLIPSGIQLSFISEDLEGNSIENPGDYCFGSFSLVHK